MVVQQQVKSEGKDHADTRVESDCRDLLIRLLCRVVTNPLIFPLDCSNPEYSLSGQHGRHRRCPNIPSNSRDRTSRFHACDESVMDHISYRTGIRPEIPAGVFVGAILQLCGFRHRNLHQHPH